jgi:hypothetical protein
MIDPEWAPYFAAHTKMQDAAKLDGLDYRAGPASASLQIAKILTVFEDRIDEEWRHDLVMLGGALLRLDRDLEDRGDG